MTVLYTIQHLLLPPPLIFKWGVLHTIYPIPHNNALSKRLEDQCLGARKICIQMDTFLIPPASNEKKEIMLNYLILEVPISRLIHS